jgi:hypothetical protein
MYSSIGLLILQTNSFVLFPLNLIVKSKRWHSSSFSLERANPSQYSNTPFWHRIKISDIISNDEKYLLSSVGAKTILWIANPAHKRDAATMIERRNFLLRTWCWRSKIGLLWIVFVKSGMTMKSIILCPELAKYGRVRKDSSNHSWTTIIQSKYSKQSSFLTPKAVPEKVLSIGYLHNSFAYVCLWAKIGCFLSPFFLVMLCLSSGDALSL